MSKKLVFLRAKVKFSSKFNNNMQITCNLRKYCSPTADFHASRFHSILETILVKEPYIIQTEIKNDFKKMFLYLRSPGKQKLETNCADVFVHFFFFSIIRYKDKITFIQDRKC